jgi:hypothetical protein
MTQRGPKIANYKTHFRMKLTYNARIMILRKGDKSKHCNNDMDVKMLCPIKYPIPGTGFTERVALVGKRETTWTS